MASAEWRFGHGWTEEELSARLQKLRDHHRNFPTTGPGSQEGMDWRRYYSQSVIALEKPGPPEPGGAFKSARKAIVEYQFSDPGIVVGHFDPNEPLRGRNMLLEIKIMGLRYLCGVRVGAVREKHLEKETIFAFRYDTLDGHMETGSEWFFLRKSHETGEVTFRISASWKYGHFPNWWSRVGFYLFSHRYQLAWHRLAYLRLREIAKSEGQHLLPVPDGEGLFHTGPEILNSDIWVLNEPDVQNRVQAVNQDSSAHGPDIEKR